MMRLLLVLALLAVPPGIRYGASGKYVVGSGAGIGSGGIGYPLPAFDWYVDSVNGLDANAGTSQDAPLQTIAALLGKTITAGQRIGLAKGSTWREELVVPAASITVAAYGTGNRPLLDASDALAASAWSKTGGLTAVYQASVAIDWVASKTFVSAWANSVRLVRATSAANCDATAGSYFPSAENTSPITLYVHLAADANPGALADGYVEYSKRKHGLDSRDDLYVRVVGVATRRNLHHDGSLIIGKYGRAEGTLSTEGNNHCVYARTGSTLVDAEALDVYFISTGPTHFVFNEDTPANEGVSCTGCYAHNTTYGGVPAGGHATPTGFYSHKNTSGSFGTITYTNCRADKVARGFGGFDASIAISNPTVSATSIAFVPESAAPMSVTGGTYTGLVDGFASPQNGSTLTLQSVTASLAGKSGIYIASFANGVTLKVYDSTLGPFTTLVSAFSNASGPTIDLQRNTYTGITAYFYYLPTTWTGTSNHNSFSPTTGNKFNVATVDKTYVQWKALGQDANSTP
jgi:hypothetical protein